VEELTVLRGFVEYESILFPRLLHLAPALSKVNIAFVYCINTAFVCCINIAFVCCINIAFVCCIMSLILTFN
jgi:hypothetical protein